MNLELQPTEEVINTWTVIFLPKGGDKYNGKLTVTNKRLVYDMLYNIKSISNIVTSSYAVARGENSVIEIPKTDIIKVEVEKSFFAKKVHVTVTDGTVFTFSYGMMNIDPVAEAIKAK
ncbi:MAG: hypothetical protein ABIX01_12705 [Chitinophagaceae bacterium]